MKHYQIFNDIDNLNKFLIPYSASEVIITMDIYCNFHVWTNHLLVECVHCNRLTPEGKYCTWCGEESP